MYVILDDINSYFMADIATKQTGKMSQKLSRNTTIRFHVRKQIRY